VVAVCDLDAKRLAAGKKWWSILCQSRRVRRRGENYHDYHEVLAAPEIDAWW